MAKHKGAAKIAKKNEVLKALDITYVTHDKIVPNTYNPNRQSDDEFELLKRSMTEDGFTQPIVSAFNTKTKRVCIGLLMESIDGDVVKNLAIKRYQLLSHQ